MKPIVNLTHQDLTWSRISYDAGHPKCICSACKERIKSPDEFEMFPQSFEEDPARDNFCIRILQGKGKDMIECTMHLKCFQELSKQGFFKGLNINLN